MKKVLILAYDFPPYVSVGALRPSYWFNNFYDMGIMPIVITRNWNPIHGNDLDYIEPSDTKETVIEQTDNGTIIRTPYKATLSNKLNLKHYNSKAAAIVKKLSTGWNEIAQWYLPTGTKYELYKAAKKYLKNNKVDVILATGEPFILFRYASLLSRKYNIPWVADYRDPWSSSQARRKGLFQKIHNKYLEIKYLKNVSLISTVSEYVKCLISRQICNSQIVIITNGFDEQNQAKCADIKQTSDVLTIALAGSILDYHPFDLFLSVLSRYISETKSRIRLNLYGVNNEAQINNTISRYNNLIDSVNIYPRMANGLIVQKLAESNVLLLFSNYQAIGTKIFDYLSLNRKILFCFENDAEANELKMRFFKTQHIEGLSEAPQIDVIKQTNSGIIVQDSSHLYNVLGELTREFNSKGYISNNTTGADEFSRKEQTKKLVKHLNGL